MDRCDCQFQAIEERRPWMAPAIRIVGDVGEVLQGGGGKLSINTDDTGDIRKPPGQE